MVPTQFNSVSEPVLTAEPKAARIQVVDALRGFALFGIFLVHCAEWYAAGPLPGKVYEANAQGVANGIVQTIVGVLFSGKFFTFFSFLFGLSFALMLTRATGPKRAFYGRFIRRLLILGVIGFLHHLQWQGDILSIYAMLGFVMLLFGGASTRLVLIVATLLVLNLPARLTTVYQTWINPPAQTAAKATPPKQPENTYEKEAATFYETLKEGTYTEVVVMNYKRFKNKMEFQVESGRLYVTLGFFLLGLYAGRKRLFQQLADNRQWLIKLTKYTGFSVLGITAVGVGLIALYGSNKNQEPPKAIILLFNTLFDTQSALLTVFYITSLTLLFQRRSWQWVIGPLSAIGKMALTNYIFQTLLGCLIFYGYGLGLIGRTSVWQGALLTFPLFFGLIVFSQWWLARFRFGPLEWLWRSLTEGKAQPMRREITSSTV